MRRYEPKLRLVKWPTPDWYYANGLYRFIKTTFQKPVEWAGRVRWKGTENIPESGGAILVINHFSWADPVVMGVALKRPAFYLAKEALFRNATVAWLLQGLGQIKVDRERGGNQSAIQQAVAVVESGAILGVFPEGTRSRPGEVKRGKTGMARIALLTGAPVIPVAMTTDNLWPKGSTLPKIGKTVYVNIGKPMYWAKDPQAAKDRDLARKITDDVMEEVKRLLDEAKEAQAKGEKWN